MPLRIAPFNEMLANYSAVTVGAFFERPKTQTVCDKTDMY